LCWRLFMRAGIRNIGNRAHNKGMQSDQNARYALCQPLMRGVMSFSR
jgi:hypothetical protein